MKSLESISVLNLMLMVAWLVDVLGLTAGRRETYEAVQQPRHGGAEG